MILDDGGDATMYVHQGRRAREAGDRSATAECDAEGGIKASCQERQPSRPTSGRGRGSIKGVSEETTTGVHRLYQMVERGELPFPAMNVNDSVTKIKFDNLYGCRHASLDGIMRATDVMLAGKVASSAATATSARAAPSRSRPGRTRHRHRDRPDLRAAGRHGGLRGRRPRTTLDEADIFVTTTGNKDIITPRAHGADEGQAIVCNIGHFDNEIQMAELDEGRCSVRTSRPRSIAGSSPTATDLRARRGPPLEPRLRHRPPELRHELLHQPGAGADRALAERVALGVYILPKQLDEGVARLHLDKLGVKLTVLSKEQADYLGVPQEGPYKPELYRY